MEVLTYIGAGFTALIGTAGLLFPRRTSMAIGLSVEGDKGAKAGLSQFRATLGGFFVALGVAAFFLPPAGAFILGIAWVGAAIGRLISLIVDRNISRANILEMVGEALIGGLLVAGYLL